MVVRSQVVGNKFPRSVSVQVIAHVITLGHHIGTHLVEGGGRDHVALAVDLPGDGSVLGASVVVTGSSGGGTGVLGDLGSHLAFRVDNHTAEEIGVVVGFVVDNGEDLGLNTDLHVGVEGIK